MNTIELTGSTKLNNFYLPFFSLNNKLANKTTNSTLAVCISGFVAWSLALKVPQRLLSHDRTDNVTFIAVLGSISVSGKLRTYPSPNPTVTLTY